MSTPIRVLILEDRPEDAELVVHELRRADFAVEWQRVETEKDFIAALDPSLDLIIADYSLPQFDGLRALKIVRARSLDLPFIIVSGTIGEDLAVAAMRGGANDYLLKDRLTRLGPAVGRAMEEQRLHHEKQRADEQMRQTQTRLADILKNAAEAIVTIDRQQRIVVFNQAAEKTFGYAEKEILGQPLDLLLPDGITGTHRQHVRDFAASPDKTNPISGRSVLSARRKDGSLFPVEIGLSKLVEGSEELYTAMIVDVTERKRAEEEIKTQLAELQRWHNVTLGRESRIIDLKREVNELLKQSGKPPRYASAEAENKK